MFLGPFSLIYAVFPRKRLHLSAVLMFLAFCFVLFSELKKTKVDLETLKSQATSTNNEYDRLLKEHEKLQVSCM